MKQFDLIVIGTGSGATTAAYAYKKAGFSVAIVDEKPYGGTCALRGCDPKKVLVGVAELIDHGKRMRGYGIEGKNSLKWPDLMQFKKTFTDSVPQNRENEFKKAGFHCFHGKASFLNENHLKIGKETLQFDKILIASGAKPRSLSIEGEEYVLHSDDFLELPSLPEEIVFIGGGFISFEFAHIAARAGANVHILQRGDKPLKNFDENLVNQLVEQSKELGIKLHLHTIPKRIEKTDLGYVIHMEKESKEEKITANIIIHGAGRVPNVEGLMLERAQIVSDKSGIKVDNYLKSISNPRVYAAGDVVSGEGLPLTPVASMESKVLAYNLLHDDQKTPDYSVIPSVVFTTPPLAMVGLTEKRAKEAQIAVTVEEFNTREWYSYKRTREKVAGIKIIKNKTTGKIVGAHVLGKNAGEMINYFAFIMKFDLPLEDVKNMIFAYPTLASDLPYLL